jgi:4-amino-4-deoxy-L-arabinose transferase-like glycosyltransferase
MSSRTFAPAFLIALCLFCFFYGLTAGPLYKNESLRAILAAEVLRSGDWIVPRLYGEPILTKPPGMYIAIALVSWPFGEVTEVTARLPSAIAASFTVFLFYWYFKRQLGKLAGYLAAIILTTSWMWLDKAPSAEIDMLQVAWVSAAILFFLRAVEGEERLGSPALSDPLTPAPLPRPSSSCTHLGLEGRRRGQSHRSRLHLVGFWWWQASLLCVAGGLLTKWTAPAFFYGMAIPFLMWRRQVRLLWKPNHLLAALVGASLCFAWAGLVIRDVGWEIFYRTVSREALMRLSPAHHDRPYPWTEVLAHPFVLLGANLPWSVCALATLWPGFNGLWDERGKRLIQAMHCWIWPNLLFWTLVPDHASRHSMPLCPGISGLAAIAWLAWMTGKLSWRLPRLRPRTLLAEFVVIWILVKIAFVSVVVPLRNGEKVPLMQIVSPAKNRPTRAPRAKGIQIDSLVPAGHTLYLFQLKDEGIMFYYGRPVKRLVGPEQLPSSSEPLYCILTAKDLLNWPVNRPRQTLFEMIDEQGDPIQLVRTDPLTGTSHASR